MSLILASDVNDFADTFMQHSKSFSGREEVLQNFSFNQAIAYFIDNNDFNTDSKLKLIRALRNCCCGDDRVSLVFIENGIINISVKKCLAICIVDKTTTDEINSAFEQSSSISESDISIVLAHCQLMSNFSASGEMCTNYLFNCSDNLTVFRDLFAFATVCHDAKISATVLGIMYNCICGESSSGRNRLEIFCSHRPLLCQLLLLVMNSTKGNKTASPADKTNEAVYEATDPIMEWLQLIGFLLVKRQKIFQIYQLVGSSTSTDSSHTVAVANHEQLILLQILLSVLEDVYCSPDIVTVYETDERRYFDQLVLLLADKVCKVIGSEGKFLDTILATESSSNTNNKNISSGISGNIDSTVASIENQSDIDASIARIDHNIAHGLNVDFLILALQVIGTSLAVLSTTITAATTEHSSTHNDSVNQLKAAIVHNTQLIQRTSALIANYHVGARSRIDPLYGKNTSRICSDGETAVKDIVKSTLQLLGNVVYNYRDAQLLLKDCGGLATVLSHCATDFVNPLAREWALFCVRNACANCLSNQEFIESLRPQSVSIQDEDMKAKGIEVEMTGTGKFKFVQKTGHHSVDSAVCGALGNAVSSSTHNSSSSEVAGSGGDIHNTAGSGSNSGTAKDDNNSDTEHDSDSDCDNGHKHTANTTTSSITQAQVALQSDSKVAQGKGERKAREELEE